MIGVAPPSPTRETDDAPGGDAGESAGEEPEQAAEPEPPAVPGTDGG
jgi:hypothetical protein